MIKNKRQRNPNARPRLAVFISGKHLYAQVIDDKRATTLVAVNDKEVGRGKNIEIAQKVGSLIAEKALKQKIKKVVFDRRARKYHGRVKTLAEAAREKGLEF